MLRRKEIFVDTKLISKKDLLQRYGISYGALYRWKRKGLIPEDWFIKTATETGQETFFVEETICARIEQILSRGENTSLDDLAATLVPDGSEPRLRIVTSSGEKTFLWEEIRGIYAENGSEGEEITQRIAALFERKG